MSSVAANQTCLSPPLPVKTAEGGKPMVSHENLAEKIGELRGSLQGLQNEVSTVKRDVHDLRVEMAPVRDAISQARGGWKTLLAVGAIAGAAGALLSKLIPFLRI